MIVWIKRLIWTYFWLLIFEGALRKWVAPALAGPLLLIRDPFVIVIYALTYRAGLFPRGIAMTAVIGIALLSLFAGLVMLPDNPNVALYGFQADFLHLPLLFIIPRVFDSRDVVKVGYWALVLSIPMAILMAAQFKAPDGSWLNAGAGLGASQITFAAGHVRSSGTFSFVTGPMLFFSLVAAFLFEHLFSGKRYQAGLVVAAAIATAIAAPVTGSRTMVADLGAVFLCAAFIGMFLKTEMMLRFVRILCLLFFVGIVVSQLPIFNEGLDVFTTRVAGANAVEGGTNGVLQGRVLAGYEEPFDRMVDAPPLGQGLGVGTAGGATLMNGTVANSLNGDSEMEWDRVMSESGPFLGLLFILLRAAIVVGLGWTALRWGRCGITLPLLLFSACGINMLSANFGQATEVGFAVFIGGMCLAAMRVPVTVVARMPPSAVTPEPMPAEAVA